MLTGMEVANASMYDGSTAAAEAVLMAHRITRRRKAVLAGNLHPHYRDTIATVSRLADDEVEVLAPRPGGSEDLASLIDDTVSCVVVQTPDVFGHLHDLRPIAANGARGRRAAGRRRHRDRVARPGGVARRDGRRHRGRGRPVARQSADLRRALRRPVRDAAEIRAADARAARRRDRRCGRTARLRADAFGARAAHPPREGDLQHLHQFRPVRARLHDPSHAARRSPGLRRLARINHANAVALAERLAAIPGVTVLNDTFFNEFTIRRAAGCGAADRAAWRRRACSAACRSRGSIPNRPELADSDHRGLDRGEHRGGSRRVRRRH